MYMHVGMQINNSKQNTTWRRKRSEQNCFKAKTEKQSQNQKSKSKTSAIKQ